MTLRLTDADDDTLAQLASALGVSKQEAVVRAIREAAQRTAHRAQVAELTDQVIDRYGDLLDRLGQ